MNLTTFKDSHKLAFRALAEYAKEDSYSAPALAHFLKAPTVQDLCNRRDALLPYLACSAMVDHLHSELGS